MRARALALGVVVLVALGGCGPTPGQAKVPGAGAGAGEVAPDAVPPVILGLQSAEENVATQFEEAKNRAYVSSVRMWSLREGKALKATVQVARFAADASPEKLEFRRTVVAQVGQTAPRTRFVGEDIVYVTAANKQAIFMWFRNIDFVLLSVSVDYPNPRALMRAALSEVKP